MVNTPLYGAHLASGGAVLPEHDVVVFDEAHELEEVMTVEPGRRDHPGRFRRAGRLGPRAGRPRRSRLLRRCSRLGDQIGGLLADRVGTRVLHDDAQPPVDDRELAELLGRRRGGRRAGRPTPCGRSDLQALAAGRGRRSAAPDADRRTRRGRISAAGHLTDDLHRLLARARARSPGSRAPRATARCGSPRSTSGRSSRRLWGEVTAVLTTATVPPGLEDRVGLEGFARSALNVGSPFDYRAHSLLYVARHLPDRRAPQAEAALHESSPS